MLESGKKSKVCRVAFHKTFALEKLTDVVPDFLLPISPNKPPPWSLKAVAFLSALGSIRIFSPVAGSTLHSYQVIVQQLDKLLI